jgi:hypothetical protein
VLSLPSTTYSFPFIVPIIQGQVLFAENKGAERPVVQLFVVVLYECRVLAPTRYIIFPIDAANNPGTLGLALDAQVFATGSYSWCDDVPFMRYILPLTTALGTFHDELNGTTCLES